MVLNPKMTDEKAAKYVDATDVLTGWIAGTWRSHTPNQTDPPSALATGSLSQYLSRRSGQPGWIVVTPLATIMVGSNNTSGGPDKALFALKRDIPLHLVGRKSNKIAFGSAALEVTKRDLGLAATLAQATLPPTGTEPWPYETLAVRPPALTSEMAGRYLAAGDQLEAVISGRWGTSSTDVATTVGVAAASFVLTAGRLTVIQTSCVPGTSGWLVFSRWAILVIGPSRRDGAPGPILTALMRDDVPPLTGKAGNQWRFANRSLTISDADLERARSLAASSPPPKDWSEAPAWPYAEHATPDR